MTISSRAKAAVFPSERPGFQAGADLLGCLAFALLTALGAWIQIRLPFTPVPFTLQTFFVLLAGPFLGRRLGAISMALYLALGFLGWGLFAGGGSGFLILLGPTGGYLLGFILAGYALGALRERRLGYGMQTASMLLCSLLILALGTLHLGLCLGLTPEKALWLGLIPFVPGEAVKALVAASLWRAKDARAES